MVKKIIWILFILFSYNQAFGQGYLHRNGQNIENDNGVIDLKGVNLGNWLVIEGYIMGTQEPAYQSPSDFRAEIENLTGSVANADLFYDQFKSNFITQTDIDSIAAKGFNHVRLPFHYTNFYDTTTSTLINDGFQYIDNLINWCTTHNIYIILDMHCAPGAQNTSHHSDSDGSADLWSDYTTNKQITIDVWNHIANYYKNEPIIGGYDLINEPVIPNQADQWKLLDLYQSVTSSIRSVDNNHLVIAEGNYYASSLWELILDNNNPSASDRWDDNLAFSIHNYWTTVPFSGISDIENIAQGVNVPVWLGEFGENSNHWLASAEQAYENKNWGWAFWNFKKVNSINAIYSIPENPAYTYILEYWKGNVSQPSTADALSGLLALANDASISNTTERKDVVDALMRDDFLINSIPFKTHIIPTTIDAVDYDMGANGVSSSDQVYQTTSNPPFTNWNSGWTYRNDGVDIEQRQDGNHHIAWISIGEEINYTFESAISAYYNIEVWLASNTTGGSINILLDNNSIGAAISVPNTGGWYNFQPIQLSNINIPVGSSELKIVIDQPGFNIDRIVFTEPTLPIELLDFNAQYDSQHHYVLLDWRTLTERNNDYFIIQKSLNGHEWIDIGRVDGQGTTTEINNYFFIDKNIINRNTYYYKLKSFDLDGTVNHFLIRTVHINGNLNSKIEIFPNPIGKGKNIDISNRDDISEISLFSLTGTEIKIDNLIDIQIPNDLSSGIYLIKIKFKSGSMEFKKIIVQ